MSDPVLFPRPTRDGFTRFLDDPRNGCTPQDRRRPGLPVGRTQKVKINRFLLFLPPLPLPLPLRRTGRGRVDQGHSEWTDKGRGRRPGESGEGSGREGPRARRRRGVAFPGHSREGGFGSDQIPVPPVPSRQVLVHSTRDTTHE